MIWSLFYWHFQVIDEHLKGGPTYIHSHCTSEICKKVQIVCWIFKFDPAEFVCYPTSVLITGNKPWVSPTVLADANRIGKSKRNLAICWITLCIRFVPIAYIFHMGHPSSIHPLWFHLHKQFWAAQNIYNRWIFFYVQWKLLHIRTTNVLFPLSSINSAASSLHLLGILATRIHCRWKCKERGRIRYMKCVYIV